MTLSIADPVIKPIYMDRSSGDPEYLRDVGITKRFLEVWTGDDEFRKLLETDPDGAVARWGLEANPHELRPMWDQEFAAKVGRDVHPSVSRYRGFIIEKLKCRVDMRNRTPRNPAFKNWRQRQVNRCAGELGFRVAAGVVHPTISLELSRGCSVGCWFCGISAPKLDDIWYYTPENQKFWCETLEVLSDFLGPEAHGFCYWATDPLDNPDYEKFCVDYNRIIGHFPQTTTAQPMKDPDRVRRLLELSHSDGHCDRFSILTKGLLKKVMAEFTPEELVYVELICQNQESTLVKARAGNALNHLDRFDKERVRKGVAEEFVNSGTIACVSGFLLQPIDKMVRLVSPCHADERWPKGYRILKEARFETPAELESLIQEWCSPEAMPLNVPNRRPLSLRRDLKVSVREGQDFAFHLANEMLDLEFLGPPVLAQNLPQGFFIPDDFALKLEREHQIPLEETLLVMERMYRYGVLEEEIPVIG